MIIFLTIFWLVVGTYIILNNRISSKSKTVFFTILGVITVFVVVVNLIG